jgi:D-aspartate ligase
MSEPIAVVLRNVATLRSLGYACIPCAFVSHAKHPMRHSRFAAAFLSYQNADNDQRRLTDVLLAFSNRQIHPPILFYATDPELLYISRNREQLAPAYQFLLPEAELVETLVDKSRFLALAARLDLPVPRTALLSAAGDAGPILEDLNFPCIVKPPTRDATWRRAFGEHKAVVIENRLALARVLEHLGPLTAELLVQEMIAGPESEIESYHVYVDPAGDIAAEFTGKKLRTYPISCGGSTALEISDAADTRELGRAITAKLPLRGCAKLDFKRGPDGRLYLLEINPRFTLWHELAAAAGLNMPAMLYSDVAGLPRPAVQPARVGATWCDPARDFMAARAMGLPFLDWLRWTSRCAVKAHCELDDPMPLVHAAGQLLWSNCRQALGGTGRAASGLAPRKA